jgi:hypothetical protein
MAPKGAVAATTAGAEAGATMGAKALTKAADLL